MKVKIHLLFILLFFSSVLLFCSKSENEAIEENTDTGEELALDYSTHELPQDINWITNNNYKTFASTEARKGGQFNYYINSFPLTFRTVGPDSNTSTRSYFLNNHMSLIDIHPNTEEPVPALATHWAFDKDGKTMYFKLNKKAVWSDGKQVTADDYIYTLEFMRSKHINAPWYNNYYTKEIDKVIKYDDYTISISAPKKVPDLWLRLPISPIPKHFYGRLDKDFVKKYNWKIEPNTGAYILRDYSKGKYLIFERKKDWWAKDLRYYENRYNVDRFKLIVIRDDNVAFEYFKKGNLDCFPASQPEIWHQKGNGGIFDQGYARKIQFYNDTRRPTYGFWLNMDRELFKDINVRYAFAHAVNFEKLNSNVLRDDYERLHTFDTGYGKYTNRKIKARKYSIKKVEKYMQKAGWNRGKDGIWEKNGQRYSVEITYGSPIHNPKMVFLKEEAKKAGIEYKLDLLDPSTWYKKLVENKHMISFMGLSGGGLRPSPWQAFHSANAHKPQTNNATNTDDAEMDKLIEAYDNSVNANERIKLSHKIQQRIHDICAWVPLYQMPYTRSFYWKWMKVPNIPGTKNSSEVFGDPGGVSIFWIDEDEKKETLKAMKEGKVFEPVTIIDKTYKAKN
ncbi:MAG: ABC transporter substrate-binding protein [Spirochaetes bacterium]|nr:ABC transporter substrate-binding protein [Spirochaetota bacterium]